MDFVVGVVILLSVYAVIASAEAMRRSKLIELEMYRRLDDLDARFRRYMFSRDFPSPSPPRAPENEPKSAPVSDAPAVDPSVLSPPLIPEDPEQIQPVWTGRREAAVIEETISEPEAPQAPPEPSKPPVRKADIISENAFSEMDWERFTGVKLFAWIGGLALFVGAIYFVKYSIDRNLIPPQARLAIGAVTGVSLVLWSLLIGDKQRYKTTVHSLAAGGVAILYAVSFAATAYYEYLSKPAGFGLVCLISAATFVLSIHHRGRFISVLGTLGAYATPILINTGRGDIYTLFIYLSVVNLGLLEVIKRMSWQPLLALASVGTLVVLALCAWAAINPAGDQAIAFVSMANLLFFTGFLGRYRKLRFEEISLHLTWIVIFGCQLVLALYLTGNPGPWPLVVTIAGTFCAVTLGYVEKVWYPRAVVYAAVTFLAILYWALRRFDVSTVNWEMALFLLYGAVGGIGPLLLMMRHGVTDNCRRWLRIFPAALVAVGLLVLVKSPDSSAWFWPMLLVLHGLGLVLSFITGSIVQVIVLTVLVLASGMSWIVRTPWDRIGTAFFLALIAAGTGACLLTVLIIRRVPAMGASERFKNLKGLLPRIDTDLTRWTMALPVLGPFILLAAILVAQPSLNPNPAMATALCFLVIVVYLARRVVSAPILGAALVAMMFVEGAWGFRLNKGDLLNLPLLYWAGSFWAAALIVPALAFRPVTVWKEGWQAWSLFELVQFLLLMTACDKLWDRQLVGWIPLAAVILKLPEVGGLLKALAGKRERNPVLAFHGGVLLFYMSAVPFLLLDYGWFGAALVIESAALLWLNRRIEHPGLRLVSSVAAPLGLVSLAANLDNLRRAGDLPVFNEATLAVALCVAVLSCAVAYAEYPSPLLGKVPLRRYFLWLAVGTGFFLLNLILADYFGADQRGYRFKSGTSMVQYLSFSILWSFFGAILWRTAGLPRSLRYVGLGLIVAGWGRVLAMPYFYSRNIGDMSPFFNLTLFGFLAMLAIVIGIALTQESEVDYGWIVRKALSWMAVILGLMALTVQLWTVFQNDYPFIIAQNPGWPMNMATTLSWFIYGLVMVAWPRPLGGDFRTAGAALAAYSVFRAASFPLKYADEFGRMVPVANVPGAVFALMLAALLYLARSRRKHAWTWQEDDSAPRQAWGVLFTVFAFYVINIEVASFFGAGAGEGGAFTFATRNSLAHQLAYSISWLVFGFALLVVGMRCNMISARWAAILLFGVTALKVFLLDLSQLSQLYRVASLIGLAVILLVASFLYQRNLKSQRR